MLKTLRITSLIALVLAVCGVLFTVFWGLRENPDVVAYLDNPGIVKQFEDKVTDGGKKELKTPLVDEAHKFALRINPPPPPAPPTPVKKDPPVVKKGPERKAPTPTPPPTPKVKTDAKFTLLATVLCQADPSRSMVLLSQTVGREKKQEWFWQGERVGNLDIDEVRNGSAIFSQGGRNPQEYFVPVKPQEKSLLKADAVGSKPSVTGSSSINVRLDAPGEDSATAAANIPSAESGRPANVSVASRSAQITRKEDTSEARRAEVSSRIRRIRTVPKQPTPAEQKASLENSISTIQEIMSRAESGADEEQRKKENETWARFLKTLQEEKENIQVPKDAPKEAGETSEMGDEDASNAENEDAAETNDEGASETNAPQTDPNEE